jgi:TPR repeat protein
MQLVAKDRARVVDGCGVCEWLRAFLCSGCELQEDAFWLKSDEWETDASNADELWEETSVAHSAEIRAANALWNSAPEQAFARFQKLASLGSVFAMEVVAWGFWSGTGVAQDKVAALEMYERAVSAGSWKATIGMARLLAELGRRAEWEALLEQGISANYVPAYFWKAHLTYRQAPGRLAARTVRPLLDYAIVAGHPGARLVLLRYMIRGRFGLRNIPRGLRLGWEMSRKLVVTPKP